MNVDALRESVRTLEATVLPASDELRGAYERVCALFERDLADERDALLARAAALMLIGELGTPSG